MLQTSLIVVCILFLTLLVKYFLLLRELLQKNKEIETLNRKGSDFVANVSHELKTPLTSIKGYTETLRSVIARDPVKALDFLDRIAENTERLSLLINDILELSRIEQPNFYLEKSTFSLSDLFRELEERFSHTFKSRKQALAFQNTVDTLEGDRWLVDQALSNLIENAHKYSSEGGLVEISSSLVSESGRNFVQLVVSDNGPGIDSKDLPQIFDRFYRADKSRTRASGGTGLGLAIAKHIMLSHGGHIRAESGLGKGAKFYLIFPR